MNINLAFHSNKIHYAITFGK